ncbi:MAG TPA: hypothetical protein VFQ88_02930 [Nevskiaceae bacterium]|nr:hypothetical protein [Nevskiaceae bacterium]
MRFNTLRARLHTLFTALMFPRALTSTAELWWRRLRAQPQSIDIYDLRSFVPAGKFRPRKRPAMRGVLAATPFAVRRDVRNGLAFAHLLLPLLCVSALCYGASFMRPDLSMVLRLMAAVGAAGFLAMPVALFGNAAITLIDLRLDRGIARRFDRRHH